MMHSSTAYRILGGGRGAGGARPRRSWASALATALLTLVLAGVLPPVPSGALGQAQAASGRESVTVALNQSRVINLRSQAARVSVANPEIADILVIDPRQVYVVGKQLGTTNVVLWDANDKVSGTINLEVTPDLDLLKTRLHEVLPGERVQVRSAQGAIVVSGEVSSRDKAEAAVQLAQSFANAASGGEDKAKVLNLIQIGGSQQVMLEVKVAEISRSLSKRLDINFTSFYNGGSVKIGTVGGAGPPSRTPSSRTRSWAMCGSRSLRIRACGVRRFPSSRRARRD
jgi:pilus assembly protein CpaC